jgi:tetratricopeptide (TPR) repeat protein
MADMKKKKAGEVEEVQVLVNVQGFWERNSKKIISVSMLVILGIGGWLGYKNFIVEPNEKKAFEAMSRAQVYFGKDSLDLALNGDGANAGFLKIMKSYSGTKAANLAHYYAGSIYLHKNDFNNAVKYLKDFETSSNLIQSRAWKMMGDAYMSLGKKQEGIDYYLKAGKLNPKDEFTSSECLFLAGLAYETIGKNKEAGDAYLIIKEKYPKTMKGGQVDKYLARLGILTKD